MRSVLLCFFVLLASCATFESGELAGLDRWPPTAASEPSNIAISIDGLPSKFVNGWQRGAEKALLESKRCATVTTDPQQANQLPANERQLQLVFEHTRSNLWVTRSWMFVCAMSAAVIPARTAQQFGIRAIISDGSGKQLGVIERQVEGVTWVGLLPLFAMPFAGAGLSSLIDDSMRSIVVEAVDRGLL